MPTPVPMMVQCLGTLYVVILIAGVWVSIQLWRRGRRNKAPWRRRAQRLRDRAFSPLTLGMMIWIIAVAFLAVGGVASLVLDGDSLSPNATLVISSLSVHWPVILFCIVLLRVRGTTWLNAFGWSRRRWRGQLGAGGVAYLAMMPWVLLYIVFNGLLLETLGFDPKPQDVAKLLISDAPWPLQAYKAGVAVLLAPVAEELLFRGMVFSLVLRYVRPPAAMLIVSLLFASIHFSLTAFLPLLVVSMALCLGYLATGRIAVPIVMHVLFNTLNLAWFWAIQ